MPTFRFPSAPSLRNRQRQPTRLAQSTTPGSVGVAPARGRAWPSPYVILRGPGLLLRGPRLLLRAPGAVLRAPGRGIARTQRLFSSSRRIKTDKGKSVEGESANAEAGPSSASDSFTGESPVDSREGVVVVPACPWARSCLLLCSDSQLFPRAMS